MSKNIIYDWQKWIDGYSTINEITDHKGNLLTEMKQRIIKFLSDEISEAESGKYDVFADIFGAATPDNPNTRMLMPYGNKDVATMKLIMAEIREKIIDQISSKSNVRYHPYRTQFEWKNELTTVQQKMKPQGWLPGDDIRVVEKEVSNLTLNYEVEATTEPNKTIKGSASISKLIPKYAPEYVEWWQGNKAKDISGKQTFFSNNPQTVSEIAYYVNDTSLENVIEDQKVVEKVVILSRHPIDVVRMSDFSTLDYSCHSQHGAYFECAMEEAKRTVSSGGGVLFTVSTKEFNDRFPDGKIPQTGDIFNDKDRGITDMLPSTPQSRLRVRNITSDDQQYAVPDRKLYGAQAESFRKETLQYFVKKQIHKFVDPETKQPILPSPTELVRWGGSYEDPYEDRVGNNFITLMKDSFKVGGVNIDDDKFDDLYGDQYNALVDRLLTKSIEWGGDANREQQNPKSDIGERLQEATNRVNNILNRARDQLSYIKIETPTVENDDDNLYMWGLRFFVEVKIPLNQLSKASLSLRGPKSKAPITGRGSLDGNIKAVFDDVKYNGLYSDSPLLNASEATVDMAEVTVDADLDNLLLTFYFEDIEGFNNIDSLADICYTYKRYENKINKFEFESAIRDILDMEGITTSYPFREKRDEIEKFKNRMEDTPFQYEESLSNQNSLTYSLQHDVYNKQSEAGSFPTGLALTDSARIQFDQSFKARAAQITAELNKQIGLFDRGPYDKEVIPNKYLLPKIYRTTYVIDQEQTQGDESYSNQKYDTVTMHFFVTLDVTQTEEEINFAMAFIEEVAEDPESIYDIGEKAFYQAYAPYIKKERFRLKLSEGTKRKISIWIKKQ